ncbi:MAG: transcription elongation factor GreA [Bacteroidia bacterium]|nr:MAG: transcription elongation factor GreA [Bacteroidia bacterium]
MSRGFTKDGDQEDTPLLTPRAYLPPGLANYVTLRGMRLLREEEGALQDEIRGLLAQGQEPHRVQVNHLRARLQQLQERISTARPVEPGQAPPREVAFATEVEVQVNGAELSRYAVVGADEANPRQGRISFFSPIARILIGSVPGQVLELETPSGTRQIKVLNIRWITEPPSPS